MIAKQIENSISTVSWKRLFSKRKHFTWTQTNGNASYDESTMLQMLVSSVNQSTRVGISDLKSLISSARLVQF